MTSLLSSSFALSASLTAVMVASGCGGSGKNMTDAMSKELQPTSLLPSSSTIVFSMNFEKGLKAQLAKRHMAKFQDAIPPSVAEIKEKCGIDILGGDVKKVTAGVEEPDKKETVFLVADSKFTKGQFDECVVKLGATVTEKAPLVEYTQKGRKYLAYWPTESVSVFSLDQEGPPSDFSGVMNGGLTPDLEVQKSKTNTDAVFWVLGRVPPESVEKMPGVTHFRLSVDGDDTLIINAALVHDTEDNANVTREKLDQQMGMSAMVLGSAAKNIVVDRNGVDVTVSATFTEAELDTIIKTIGVMAGAQ